MSQAEISKHFNNSENCKSLKTHAGCSNKLPENAARGTAPHPPLELHRLYALRSLWMTSTCSRVPQLPLPMFHHLHIIALLRYIKFNWLWLHRSALSQLSHKNRTSWSEKELSQETRCRGMNSASRLWRQFPTSALWCQGSTWSGCSSGQR